jgi:amino acid transporter
MAATWLLEQFGCGANNAAVAGDLEERYRQGRSRLWYWRQVLLAIIASAVQEICEQKVLTLRAIFTGWTLLLASGFLFRTIVVYVNGILRLEYRWTSILLPAYPHLSAGVLIGLSLTLSWSGWAGIGWILNRLYQPHQKAMVLAFSATVLAALALTIFTLSRSPAAIAYPTWLIAFSGNIAGVICTLMGAGFFRRLSGRQQHRGT